MTCQSTALRAVRPQSYRIPGRLSAFALKVLEKLRKLKARLGHPLARQ